MAILNLRADSACYNLNHSQTQKAATPRTLAKAWRSGAAPMRREIEKTITKRQWWHHFRWGDPYRSGDRVLMFHADPNRPRNADASLSLRLAGGVRARPLNDDVIAELTGDAPVSATRLREIEAMYPEAEADNDATARASSYRRIGDMIRRTDIIALKQEKYLEFQHEAMLEVVQSLRTLAGEA